MELLRPSSPEEATRALGNGSRALAGGTELVPLMRDGLVRADTLVYISEGFRSALTLVPHMSLLAIYPVMFAFTALFLWRGIVGFKRRVLA